MQLSLCRRIIHRLPRFYYWQRIAFCPSDSGWRGLELAVLTAIRSPLKMFLGNLPVSTSTKPADAASDQELRYIDLRDPWLAAFLAWLVPGLGHMYQRRWGKGGLFMTCILATFFYGLWLGGG